MLTKITCFRQKVKSKCLKVLESDEGRAEIRGITNRERRESQGLRFTFKWLSYLRVLPSPLPSKWNRTPTQSSHLHGLSRYHSIVRKYWERPQKCLLFLFPDLISFLTCADLFSDDPPTPRTCFRVFSFLSMQFSPLQGFALWSVVTSVSSSPDPSCGLKTLADRNCANRRAHPICFLSLRNHGSSLLAI